LIVIDIVKIISAILLLMLSYDWFQQFWIDRTRMVEISCKLMQNNFVILCMPTCEILNYLVINALISLQTKLHRKYGQSM